MWGAIIGDLAGSIYEYSQIKKVSNIEINSIIPSDAFYSDDTILTIAILDTILNNGNYKEYLKKYALEFLNYKPNFTPYFQNSFSPNFIKWVNGSYQGSSNGNGAMMRISSIGYLFNEEKQIKEEVYKATIPSHNSKEAINSATLVALIIFYARLGLRKEEIIKKLNLYIKYEKLNKFNNTCDSTINICLYSLFNSTSFEEAIKTAIYFGGDTDTNACIVGSMAEALYGIDKSLIDQAKLKIPPKFNKKLDEGYKKVRKLT